MFLSQDRLKARSGTCPLCGGRTCRVCGGRAHRFGEAFGGAGVRGECFFLFCLFFSFSLCNKKQIVKMKTFGY
jgi:hypothetical protein